MLTRPSFVALICLPVIFTLPGCGGGGGGGGGGSGQPPPVTTPTPTPTPTPGDWETDEYKAQAGLGLIKASAMYARGGTGRGITVGMLDGGATPDHPDLEGKYNLVDSFEGVNPLDTNPVFSGHGTHVSGLIAARKNDFGMHGVAYDASLASYALEFDANDDIDDIELGKATDVFREHGARIVNNSWGKIDVATDISITISGVYAVDRDWLNEAFRESLPAYHRFVSAGGVQVWGTGNSGLDQPGFHAGWPDIDPDLERGWLAVAAVGDDGELASYSQACGVAARWCLAAPGGGASDSEQPAGGAPDVPGIWSTVPPDGYRLLQGTSMAAPHVSGALAGLKSMFPNLSYQDVRNRVLATANRSAPYDDPAIYGQGLLDLDAASRPVGGLLFALGRSDDGPVITTRDARLSLPKTVISSHLAGEMALVLDSYQRAPFLVSVSEFTNPTRQALSLPDLDFIIPNLTRAGKIQETQITMTGQGFRADAQSTGAWFFGSGHGTDLVSGFANLTGVPLPHGDYRMGHDALGMAVRFASAAGNFQASAVTNPGELRGDGFGIQGWSPRSVISASLVGPQSNGALAMSFASDLKHPSGIGGSGAFALSGDSVDVGYGHTLVDSGSVKIGLGSRVTYLTPKDGAMVLLDDTLVAVAKVDLSINLTDRTTLHSFWSQERPFRSGQVRIRAARSIDQDGRIDHDDILINQEALLGLDQFGASIRYEAAPNAAYGTGVKIIHDGFGDTRIVAGARAEFRF